MKATRRNFLKATVAAPMGLKSTVDSMVAKLSGLGVTGAGVRDETATVPVAAAEKSAKFKAAKFIMRNGLPQWRRDEMWPIPSTSSRSTLTLQRCAPSPWLGRS